MRGRLRLKELLKLTANYTHTCICTVPLVQDFFPMTASAEVIGEVQSSLDTDTSNSNQNTSDESVIQGA